MINIIWLIIIIPVSLLFTGIGIYAWRRKKPMWFWSGSTVKESEISNVAYNRANGIMWLVFSLIMWISTIFGAMNLKEGKMIIRKAVMEDLEAIDSIYQEIHDREEAGEVTTGWIRDVYPIRKTAEDAIIRGDMFVQINETGSVTATGIINQVQVDVYEKGSWLYPAADDKVMVLHTLIVSVRQGHRGSGKEFLGFYEAYAREHGCSCLRLDTNARNTNARSFYWKHGYHEIGIVPTVFNGIPGVDLVLLEKKLQ